MVLLSFLCSALVTTSEHRSALPQVQTRATGKQAAPAQLCQCLGSIAEIRPGKLEKCSNFHSSSFLSSSCLCRGLSGLNLGLVCTTQTTLYLDVHAACKNLAAES